LLVVVVVDEAETVVMELSVAPKGIDAGFMMVFCNGEVGRYKNDHCRYIQVEMGAK